MAMVAFNGTPILVKYVFTYTYFGLLVFDMYMHTSMFTSTGVSIFIIHFIRSRVSSVCSTYLSDAWSC